MPFFRLQSSVPEPEEKVMIREEVFRQLIEKWEREGQEPKDDSVDDDDADVGPMSARAATRKCAAELAELIDFFK